MMPHRKFTLATVAERAGRLRYRGRGLCMADYELARRAGTLIDFEFRVMPVEYLMDEVENLLDDGITTFEGLSLRLGIPRDTISVSLRRAARRGDERATALRSRLPTRKAS